MNFESLIKMFMKSVVVWKENKRSFFGQKRPKGEYIKKKPRLGIYLSNSILKISKQENDKQERGKDRKSKKRKKKERKSQLRTCYVAITYSWSASILKRNGKKSYSLSTRVRGKPWEFLPIFKTLVIGNAQTQSDRVRRRRREHAARAKPPPLPPPWLGLARTGRSWFARRWRGSNIGMRAKATPESPAESPARFPRRSRKPPTLTWSCRPPTIFNLRIPTSPGSVSVGFLLNRSGCEFRFSMLRAVYVVCCVWIWDLRVHCSSLAS